MTGLTLAGPRPTTPATSTPPPNPRSARGWRPRPSIWLGLICLVQALLANRPGSNGNAFEDEGLYVFIGHRMIQHVLHGTYVSETPGAYFSGAPGIYPPLAAIGDSLDGLQGARAVSLVFAIIATVCVHGLTRRLYGQRAALLGAAVFATSGSVLFQSHFATFDSMAMAFVAAAGWLAVRSAQRDALLWAPAVGLLLAGAFLTKYGTGAYAPVVAMLAIAVAWQHARWTVVLRAVFALATTAIVSYFVIEYWGTDLVRGLATTTSSRVILDPAPRSVLLGQAVRWAGPWLLVAAAALATQRRRQLPVALVLLAGALAAPTQQIHLGEAESLAKHLAFSMVFLAPLAGDLLAKLSTRARPAGGLASLTVLAALTAAGAVLSHQFLTTWVDDRNLIPVLRTTAAAAPGKAILGEQPAPQRYELRTQIAPQQWQDTYSFSYDDKSSIEAYQLAIQQTHFGVIYLSLQTPTGKILHGYLTTADTPYRLTNKVARYLHGKPVGDWLVYTPTVLNERGSATNT